MSGLDFLRWLKPHPFLSKIPVIVLSGSPLHNQIHEAYALAAKTCFMKPVAHAELAGLLQVVVQYWSASNLPLSEEPGPRISI